MATSTPKKRPRPSSSPLQTEPRSPPASSADDSAPDDGAEDHLYQTLPPSAANGKVNPRRERVFTPDDEIALLNSFCTALENSGSSTPVGKNPIDAPILEEIVRSLDSRFTQTQISDKLRRLRVKYLKQNRTKSDIRTAHDHQMYELGRKVWGKDKASPAEDARGDGNADKSSQTGEGAPKEVEEHAPAAFRGVEGGVDFGKYPILVEECERIFEGNGVWRQFLKGMQDEKLREMNDKFIMVKLEEAAVMSKKSQLVNELTRLILGAVAASTPPA